MLNTKILYSKNTKTRSWSKKHENSKDKKNIRYYYKVINVHYKPLGNIGCRFSFYTRDNVSLMTGITSKVWTRLKNKVMREVLTYSKYVSKNDKITSDVVMQLTIGSEFEKKRAVIVYLNNEKDILSLLTRMFKSNQVLHDILLYNTDFVDISNLQEKNPNWYENYATPQIFSYELKSKYNIESSQKKTPKKVKQSVINLQEEITSDL